MVKDLPASTRDVRGLSSILALGRPRVGNGSRIVAESSVYRGAWRATVGLQELDRIEQCTPGNVY